jgi:TPP-dependent pyruvate/acetoin dehydrogenase alpha subunit
MDSLCVEPAQRTHHDVGAVTRSAARGVEADGFAMPAGAEYAEDAGRTRGRRRVAETHDKPCVSPVLRQAAESAAEVLGESHEAERTLKFVAKVEAKGALSEEQMRAFLRDMLLIRRFEEKVEERFRAGELPGFLHVAIGQEAVAVGVCQALEKGDVFASTHRAHGHALASGMRPNELMAELYGKVEGCSGGYGGSMHLYDIERGFLGANAVVGGGLPQITGAALAFKLRGEPRVALAFFGDGATNIGTFHESLNLAQLWQVPAVFCLENNHWAESTPRWQHAPIEDFTQRAVAYGMHSMSVDGQDVQAVHEAATEAIQRARSGDGPVLLVCETYRLVGHYVGDPQVYRPKDELRELRETQDPITRMRERLGISDDDFEQLDRDATEEVEASVEFAKSGTDPAPEDALKNVYA